MNKAYRQAQIAKIIQTRSIFTQEELAAVLAAQGVTATQVTLSRDLRELGVLKPPEGYRGAAAALPAEASKDNLERVLREFLRDVEVAQNLVVLKTQSAGAACIMPAACKNRSGAGLPRFTMAALNKVASAKWPIRPAVSSDRRIRADEGPSLR